MTSSHHLILAGALFPVLVGCAAAAPVDDESIAAVTAEPSRWSTLEEAPAYDGEGSPAPRLFRVEDDAWIDEGGFAEALSEADVVFFGEQHQTAPVQALERWVLGKVTELHPDAGLAMEHFQADEQPVIDRYFRGEIDQATFEAQSQPWAGYATYWRPLVEDARGAGAPLFALNVPKEVLDTLYAQFPARPFDAFNRIPTTSAFDRWLPARPLVPWDATYLDWFEKSYHYASHGASWGLSYADALRYFADLAHIRDETMAHWVTEARAEVPRLLVVAGDWHVQTGHALPDRVARLAPDARLLTLTTAPEDRFDAVRAIRHGDRPVADFIVTYRAPASP